MSDTTVAADLLWLLVFVWALAGSVDYGASFWRMWFQWRGQAEAARIAQHYVSPLWESTNIFLVFVVVALVGFFPGAAYVYGQVLLVPGSLILILLALRGALIGYGYALRSPLLTAVTGLSAVLLPALMVAVLPISAGGFVRTTAAGGAILDLVALLHSPTTYAYIAFGLAAGLLLSATFLADYARTATSERAYLAFRRQAAWAGPVAIAAAMTAVFIVPTPVWLRARLAAAWPWFAASLAAFGVAMSAWNWPVRHAPSAGRPRMAVLFTALQFALAAIGYGMAHAPYLLYPQVATDAAFTGSTMFTALLAMIVAGVVVLVPAFIWLWRLFVIDPRYTHS